MTPLEFASLTFAISIAAGTLGAIVGLGERVIHPLDVARSARSISPSDRGGAAILAEQGSPHLRRKPKGT